jgi:hypothetical protein
MATRLRSQTGWYGTPVTLIGIAAGVLLLGLVGPDTAGAGQSRAAVPIQSTRAADCRAIEAPLEDAAKSGVDVSPTERAAADAQARARYLAGDLNGALDVWNQLAEPRVRCVDVDGLVRTRRDVIIEYLGTESGEVFTAEALARIERRLNELSFTTGMQTRFDPRPDGTTTVTPIAVERSILPSGLYGWGGVAIRALFTQDVRVRIVSPTGRGEVWTPSVRVNPTRPRAMLRFDAPAPGRLPGMVSAMALAERQAYAYPSLGGEFEQSRYRIGGALSDWVTSWLRWEGGTAYDRIGSASHLGFDGSLNARGFDDRLALVATGAYWVGTGSHRAFATRELVAAARSTAREDVPVVTTAVGIADATRDAPLAVWPAASSGGSRGAQLRAHQLRRASVITGDTFGRTLVFATVEYEHPVNTRWGTVGLVGFVDGARASQRLESGASPFHVDVGTGIRLGALGDGSVRVDVGYGLRDGRLRLSAGLVRPWGTR